MTGLSEPLEALLRGWWCSLPLVLGDRLPGLVPWLLLRLPEGLRMVLLVLLLAEGMASWAKGWRRGFDVDSWGLAGVWSAWLLLAGLSLASRPAVEE